MYRKVMSASLDDFPEVIKKKQSNVKKELEKKKKIDMVNKIKSEKKMSRSKVHYVSKYDYEAKLAKKYNISCDLEKDNIDSCGNAKIKPVNKVSEYEGQKLIKTQQQQPEILCISDKAATKEIVSNANDDETDEQKCEEIIPQKEQICKLETIISNAHSNKSFQLQPGSGSHSVVFKYNEKTKELYSLKVAKGSNSANCNNLSEESRESPDMTIKEQDIIQNKKFSHIKIFQSQDNEVGMDINSDINMQLESGFNPKSSTSIGRTTSDNNIQHLSSRCFAIPSSFTPIAETSNPVSKKTDTNRLYLDEIEKQKLTILNIQNGITFPINAECSKVVRVPGFTLNSPINKEFIKEVSKPCEISQHPKNASAKLTIAKQMYITLNKPTTRYCTNFSKNETQYEAPPEKLPFLSKKYDTFIQYPSRDYTETITEERTAEFNRTNAKHGILNSSFSEPTFINPEKYNGQYKPRINLWTSPKQDIFTEHSYVEYIQHEADTEERFNLAFNTSLLKSDIALQKREKQYETIMPKVQKQESKVDNSKTHNLILNSFKLKNSSKLVNNNTKTQLKSVITPELNPTTKSKENKIPCKSFRDTFTDASAMRNNCKSDISTERKISKIESNTKRPMYSPLKSSISLQDSKSFSESRSSFSIPKSKLSITEKNSYPKLTKKFNILQRPLDSTIRATPEIKAYNLEKYMTVPKNFALDGNIKSLAFNNNIKKKYKSSTETRSTTSKLVDGLTKNQEPNKEKDSIKYVDFLENALEYNVDFKNNRIIRIENTNESLKNNSSKRGEHQDQTTVKDESTADSINLCEHFENSSSKKEDYQQITPSSDFLSRSTKACGFQKKENITRNTYEKGFRNYPTNFSSIQNHGYSNIYAVNVSQSELNTMKIEKKYPNNNNFRIQQPRKEHNSKVYQHKTQTNSNAKGTTIQTTSLLNNANNNSKPQILYNNCDTSVQNHNRPMSLENNNFIYNPYRNNHNNNKFIGGYPDQFRRNNSSKPLAMQTTYTESSQSSHYNKNMERNMNRPQACGCPFQNNNFGSFNLPNLIYLNNSYPIYQQMSYNANITQYPCMYNISPHMVNRNLTPVFAPINSYQISPQMSHLTNTPLSANTNTFYQQIALNNVYRPCTQIAYPNIVGTTPLLFHQHNALNTRQLRSVNYCYTNQRRPILGRGVRQVSKPSESKSSAPSNPKVNKM
ncbi:putative mediator of RNA polymerase II transcription subunit 26 [Teleopsis dalmanni]|uniref:putative mediator of RNA polymerase II transcription subunit 26 n=1 Tax=Teleopsis dalmanni TaxID=139649 RepID=UPI0018CFCCD4|nr:putative mediator of RNA polymerase II transcription subunit 26 [Teleopsis dalmanni]